MNRPLWAAGPEYDGWERAVSDLECIKRSVRDGMRFVLLIISPHGSLSIEACGTTKLWFPNADAARRAAEALIREAEGGMEESQ